MKTFLSCTCGLLLAASSLQATVLFSDDFNSYVTGNLAGTTQNAVGQGTWAQTSAASTNPIQVNNAVPNAVGPLKASGQDIYAPLPGGTYTIPDGTSFYMGVDINVASVANTSGDYFLHWSTSVGNTGIFPDRLYVKNSGTQFVLGWAGSSGTGVTYGTGLLTYNTGYRVVVEYDAVAGTGVTIGNDAGGLYVNGVSYVPSATMTSGIEPGSPEVVAEVNIRQGSSGALVTLDNLDVTTAYGEAATFSPIPEPTTAVLGGLALLGLTVLRRRS